MGLFLKYIKLSKRTKGRILCAAYVVLAIDEKKEIKVLEKVSHEN